MRLAQDNIKVSIEEKLDVRKAQRDCYFQVL